MKCDCGGKLVVTEEFHVYGPKKSGMIVTTITCDECGKYTEQMDPV